jgi:hypothetical protein
MDLFEVTSLYDLVINIQLVLSMCIHHSLNTLLSDEAQNSDSLCLSDMVSTIPVPEDWHADSNCCQNYIQMKISLRGSNINMQQLT